MIINSNIILQNISQKIYKNIRLNVLDNNIAKSSIKQKIKLIKNTNKLINRDN